MANFSASGNVVAVTQRGRGSVVSLVEKEGQTPIDIYAFGTAPMVGQEVICMGEVKGREWQGKVYPNLSGSFAVVCHAATAHDYRQTAPPPQQAMPPPPAFEPEATENDIPF